MYHSPFSRTTETAELAVAALKAAREAEAPRQGGFTSVEVDALLDLRERYFGTELELASHDSYKSVWEVDEKDITQGPAGGGVRTVPPPPPPPQQVSVVLQSNETGAHTPAPSGMRGHELPQGRMCSLMINHSCNTWHMDPHCCTPILLLVRYPLGCLRSLRSLPPALLSCCLVRHS